MLARRVRSEAGIALPVAVIVLTITMLLTAIALVSAVTSSRRTNEDTSAKLALQAANSGLDLARDRYNPTKLTQPLTALLPCVSLQAPVGSTVVRLVPSLLDGLLSNWCTAQVDNYDNGSSSSYRVTANYSGSRTVVSTGTYGNETRTVAATLGIKQGSVSLFGTYAVSSYDSLQITNTNTILGDVRTNGNLDMNSNGQIAGSASVLGALRMENSSKICSPGNVQYGSTIPYVNPYSSAQICGARAAGATAFTYPEIPAADIPSALNSNTGRVCSLNGISLLDACTGNIWARGVGLDRVLTIGSGASVTLSGSDKPYLFCGITTYGDGKLIIPAGKSIKIFIDKPENCLLASGGTKGGMSFTNDFKIDNQNCTSSNRPSDTLQFVVLGSTSTATQIDMNSNSTGCATIFAPNSTASFTNQATFYGAVAAKKVNPSANGSIVTTSGSQSVEVTSDSGFAATDFRECVKTTSTDPGAGCGIG